MSDGRARHAPGARRMPFVVLVLGLIGGGMLALLALNTASAANEVRRHNIADSDQSVAAQVEQLQIDARNSAAPENLARAAAALGMVPAGNPGFIEIGSSGAVRVLGRPAPATAPPVYVPPATPTSTKDGDRPDGHDQPNGVHRKDSKTDKDKHDERKDRRTRSHGNTRETDTHAGNHHPDDTGQQRSTPPPSPTSTPTPTITLPGGDR